MNQMILFPGLVAPTAAPEPSRRGPYFKTTRAKLLAWVATEPYSTTVRLAKELSVSPRHVRRLLRELAAEGLIYESRVISELGMTELAQWSDLESGHFGVGDLFTTGTTGVPLLQNVLKVLAMHDRCSLEMNQMGFKSSSKSKVRALVDDPVKILTELKSSRRKGVLRPRSLAATNLIRYSMDPDETIRKAGMVKMLKSKGVGDPACLIFQTEMAPELIGLSAYCFYSLLKIRDRRFANRQPTELCPGLVRRTVEYCRQHHHLPQVA